MRKTIWAALPLAVLALAAPGMAAADDGGERQVKYRAVLGPVAGAEEPAATVSRRGRGKDDRGAEDRGGKARERKSRGRDSRGVHGWAELADGPRRDRVKVRVRGLEAGSYSWELRSAAGDGDACAGAAVAGFAYGALKVHRRGGGKARGVSQTFAAEDGATYALVVTGADGDVACGEFARKNAKGGGEDAPAEDVAEDA